MRSAPSNCQSTYWKRYRVIIWDIHCGCPVSSESRGAEGERVQLRRSGLGASVRLLRPFALHHQHAGATGGQARIWSMLQHGSAPWVL